MLGNTFGRLFRVTTSGESYGTALLTIVDGVPPGLKLTKEYIQEELDKRRPGQSPIDSPRKETDQVEIVSGMLEGVSTGAPIGMIVYNVDRQKIHVDQYRDVKELIRPGHAEYTFFVKYGEHTDWCGAGRASGRETLGRVAGGAVAKMILKREGIGVIGHITDSHGIKAKDMTYDEVVANYRKNDLNCCDLEAAEKMIADLMEVRDAGDTAGGIIEIIVRGVPAGLGEPVFDKLKATISSALLGIGATTGLEFGDGFQAATMLGSEWNDLPYLDDGHVRFKTNHSGGFLGGITNGEDLVMRLAVKATPTISKEQPSVNMMKLKESNLSAITRRDISLLPRVYPVAEAMVRMAVLDAMYMAKGFDHFCKLDPKWKAVGQPRNKI